MAAEENGVDEIDRAETFCPSMESSSDWGCDEVANAETFCHGIGKSSSKLTAAQSVAAWDGSQKVMWTPRSACADHEGMSNFGRAL